MPPGRSAQSRGNRYTTSTTRGRGGITKRRGGGGQRLDRDGDLQMDADSGPRSRRGTPDGRQETLARALDSAMANVVKPSHPRGRGGHKNYNESNRQSETGSLVYLRILGVKDSSVAGDKDGGIEGLTTYLERRASAIPPRGRHLRIKEIYFDGKFVIIAVSSDDSKRVLQLDGQRFAGVTLSIETHPNPPRGRHDVSGPSGGAVKDLMDQLKGILANRYDPASKLLNLSALGQDQRLIDMGMFQAQNRISKLFPVLMAVCEQVYPSSQAKRESIESVALSDNELDNLSNVTALAQTFPDLRNLDISRNKFADLHALEGWRWKFRRLQNLLMNGNPLESATPNYAAEIVKWYPELLTLNGAQVRTIEQVQEAMEASKIAKEASHVSPIPVKGPDFRDVSRVGEMFISQFFNLYDTDRATLARTYYDSVSSHTLSVNTSAPRSQHHPTHQQAWGVYIKHSRNLLRATNMSTRIARMHLGVDSIIPLWAELPPTRHPGLPAQLDKYLIECHSISGLPDPNGQSPAGVDGLMLMVHGEFEEKNETSDVPLQRSFSRTFILGPGSQPGQEIRVINDMLVLRAWSPLTSGLPELIAKIPNGQSAEVFKNEILGQLVQRTNMTPEYAKMCLDESGWELERALVVFNAQKANLPKEAFTV